MSSLRAQPHASQTSPKSTGPLPLSPGPGRPNPRGFVAGFGHAAHGLVEAVATGRNMKVHVVCGILVSLVGSGMALGLAEQIALLACTVGVIAAESLNTAVETAIDLVVDRFDPRAGFAKDAAAGAVLILALGSVAVFATVLAAHWRAVMEQGPRVARQVAAGLPFAACGGALVARFPRRQPVNLALAVAGLGLWGLMATWTTSAAFTAMAALLFGLCIAVAQRRRVSP